MNESDRFKAGAEIRRQLVGDSYAGAIKSKGSDLRAEFADAATEHLWGASWTRPGLDMRSRSILTISLLLAKGHGSEDGLSLHLRGALRNNLLTLDEIMELVLHSSIYVGYPTAKAAMRLALRMLGTEEEPDHAR